VILGGKKERGGYRKEGEKSDQEERKILLPSKTKEGALRFRRES